MGDNNLKTKVLLEADVQASADRIAEQLPEIQSALNGKGGLKLTVEAESSSSAAQKQGKAFMDKFKSNLKDQKVSIDILTVPGEDTKKSIQSIVTEFSRLNNLSAANSVSSFDKLKYSLTDIKMPLHEVINSIGEYNSLSAKSGEEQAKYAGSISSTSSVLSGYLQSLNGGQASISGFIAHTKSVGVASQISAIGVKALSAAMGAVANVAITLAITAAVKAITYLANYSEIAAEKAREQAAAHREEAQALTETSASVGELADRYEALQSSGKVGSEYRTEARAIESEIIDLLGVQADRVDLINGKYSDNLKLLREIQLENAKKAASEYAEAYAAQPEVDKGKNVVLGQFLVPTPEVAEALSGYKSEHLTVSDDGANIVISGSDYQIYKELAAIIPLLEGVNFGGDNMLREAQIALEKYADSATFLKETADSMLASYSEQLRLEQILNGMTINSSDALGTVRRELLESVKANSDISAALADGTITLGEVKNSIDDILSRESPDFYSLWKFEEIQREIDKLNERKASLQEELSLSGFTEDMAGDPFFQDTLNQLDLIDEKLLEQQALLESYGEAVAAAFNPYNDIFNIMDSLDEPMSALTTLNDIVANGFLVSAEEARRLAEVFPDIMQNAQIAGADQMLLNQEIVESYINARENELDAAVDAAITELNLKKARLNTEKEIVEAQIRFTEHGNSEKLESEVTTGVAKLAIVDEILKACEEAGLSEAEANEIALEAMTGDWDNFSELTIKALDNMDAESKKAFQEAMNTYSEACNGKISNINEVISALDREALAVNNSALGVITGIHRGRANAGSLSSGPQKYENVDLTGEWKPSTKGGKKNLETLSDPSIRLMAAYNDAISKQASDREDLQNQLNAINSELAVVDKNISSLENFRPSNMNFGSASKSGSGSRSGSSSSAQKEVEEYTYAVNELTEAETKLREVQEDRSDIEKEISRSQSITDRIRMMGDVLEAYEAEKKALSEIRDLQSQSLLSNIDLLRTQGFQVSYDATQDKLLISNKEHINSLIGATTEETNQLRKQYEELIDTTLSLNEANRATAQEFENVNDEIAKQKMQMMDESIKIYDDFIKHADDFDLWNNMDMTKLDLLNSKLALINQRYEDDLIPTAKEYKELVESVALDIYKEQKAALDSIIDLTMKLIKQETQDQVNGLKDQITSYQKIIDLKKKALQTTKTEDNYEKEVAKKLKAIAELQARISQLSLDDSREAAAQRTTLETELSKLQEELADYQADYAYNAQIESLDSQYNSYKEEKDKEIEKAEAAVNTTVKLYQAAIERIDNDWEKLYDDLDEWNMAYGDGIKDSILDTWNAAIEAVKKYGDTVKALDGIKTSNSVSNQAGITGSGDTSKVAKVSERVAAMNSNSAAWKLSSPEQRARLEAENQRLAREIEAILEKKIYYNELKGTWHIGSENGPLLYDIYHDGGVVGDQTAARDNEVLALLEKGEMVLDQSKKSALYELVDFTGYMLNKLGAATASLPLLSSAENPLSALSRSAQELPSQPQSLAGDMNFSFDTQVHINGNPDSDTARLAGEQIGETVMGYISDSFSKRGMYRIGNAFLKP